MAEFEYDFSGYATKNNVRCSDGRIIERDAFRENHGKKVPLVWQHNHDQVYNVIGHAMLENRKDGVYAYCALNDTEMAEHARSCIKHGDLQGLSIYAKVLKETNKHVMHGHIKELSLVLSPANPGAVIDNIVMHSDDATYDAEFSYSEEDGSSWSSEAGVLELDELLHSDEAEPGNTISHAEEDTQMATEASGKTVQDVLESLNEEQSKVVEYVIEKSIEAALDEYKKSAGGSTVQHSEEEYNLMKSIFENNTAAAERPQISPEDVGEILAHAAQSNCGSLKLAVEDYLGEVNYAENTLRHADDPDPSGVEVGPNTGIATYGIADIDWLFPNAHKLYTEPDFIKRRTEWVDVVMNGVKDVPFARIKSMFTDITADAARAKGYVKGDQKVEEVVTLLRRETGPTTVYKKQKLDRDDIIDITDFNVVTYLKGEMRLMWEEEIARAILIGDGRSSLSSDKIDETKIRPILTDHELFTIPVNVEVDPQDSVDVRTKKIIRATIKGMDDYEGSGDPVMFCSVGFRSDALLLEDGQGRPRYESVEKLATAMQVKRLVVVPQLKNFTRTVKINNVDTTVTVDAIIVNLSDYARGADKGGKATMFEDFDIDYNQYKYLYEGRCSGALTKPKSALVIEHYEKASSNEEQPAG